MFTISKLSVALLAAVTASAHIVGIEVQNSGSSHHYARTLGFGGRSSFTVKFITEAQNNTLDYGVLLGLSNSTAGDVGVESSQSIGKQIYFIDLVKLGKTNTSGKNFTVKVPLRKSAVSGSTVYTLTAAVLTTSGDDGATDLQFHSAALNVTSSK